MPLFLPRSPRSKAVCYLKEIWFEDKNVRNWFQGALPLGPITNNNLGRNNGILKIKDYSNDIKHGFKELYELVRVDARNSL